MNFEKRWVCTAHPNTTIGATPGDPEPMRCPWTGCGRVMKLVEPADSRVQHTEDPRSKTPPRPQSKPL